VKAITVEPKKAGSVLLEEVAEPDEREGSVLLEGIAVGVCGTDVEIVEGNYGWSPPGGTRLVGKELGSARTFSIPDVNHAGDGECRYR
jgi:glucose 1-dehydrogenase